MRFSQTAVNILIVMFRKLECAVYEKSDSQRQTLSCADTKRVKFCVLFTSFY